MIGDDGWTHAEDVTAALVAAHGDPGGGEAGRLTQDALRSLAEMSLVEVEDAEPGE